MTVTGFTVSFSSASSFGPFLLAEVGCCFISNRRRQLCIPGRLPAACQDALLFSAAPSFGPSCSLQLGAAAVVNSLPLVVTRQIDWRTFLARYSCPCSLTGFTVFSSASPHLARCCWVLLQLSSAPPLVVTLQRVLLLCGCLQFQWAFAGLILAWLPEPPAPPCCLVG